MFKSKQIGLAGPFWPGPLILAASKSCFARHSGPFYESRETFHCSTTAKNSSLGFDATLDATSQSAW